MTNKKNKLPTSYQQVIYKSRYARWLEEQNRREDWEETVKRYIEYFRNKREPVDINWNELEQAILDLEVMPSMRALMTAGPALDRCNVAAFNPVAGDTQVLTKEYGLINIEELKGQTAHVTTIEGNWAEAKFTCYGKQPVFNVGITCKGSNIAVIQATANHRWIKLNGEVVPTSDLKVGDKIPFAAPIIQTDVNSLDYKLGIQHGLIYGDGSATYSQERTKGYHVRLCGKTSECLKYFEGYPVCYPESANGDPIVMLYSDLAKTHALKDLPQHNETDDYLVGFVRGWLAADGYVTKTSQCGLAVGAEEIDWFKSVATRLGYVIQNVYAYPGETNYGKRNKKLFCLTLDRAALVPEDFLLEYKRNNFKPNVKHFTVSFVTDANEAKEVYCAEVPDTNTFTLYKGIVTGNCSYVPIDHSRAFDEILYILMCGTGVGFSVERQSVNELPVVNEHFEDSDTTIVVEDSKSGWAKGFRELIQMLYAGRVPKWDLSKLRPAGARLKTFGGRSSGPEPLNDLFNFTVNIFRNAAGRRLRSIECHDLVCKIGDVVVVGGVRRSALISLSNLSDERMRDAKSGNWWEKNPQRALANNSVAYTEKPDIGKFMEEWTALYKSGSGERGIFNREASKKQAAKNGRRDPEHAWGTNPCSEIILRPYQFCVAGSTKLITKDNGITDIELLNNQTATIWNGEEWTEVTVRQTGTNQDLVRVILSDGSYLDCTPDHRFSVKTSFQKGWKEVQAKDLMTFSKYAVQIEPANVVAPAGGDDITDAYTLGVAVGDGCVYRDKVSIELFGNKINLPVVGNRGKVVTREGCNVPQCYVSTTLNPRTVEALKSNADAIYNLSKFNIESLLQFIAGWCDTDGSETGTGGIRLYLSGEERARAVQLLLTRCGIRSSVNLMQEKGVNTNKGIRNAAIWYLQITDCSKIPCKRLNVNEGHVPKYKGKYQNLVSVEALPGKHDTYCFTEPKKHKGLFGNVLTFQCNLSEVIVRATDTLEDVKRKVRLATILGTLQSTLTEFRYLRKVWHNNTKEECLLGVSLTGIMDNTLMACRENNIADHWHVLDQLKQTAIETNKQYAQILGVNQSTAITCVKPSGTVSQLTDTASGIHTRHSAYYIRTIRGDKKDPLTAFLIDQGIPYEECVMKPNDTVVFSFPQKAPEGALVRESLSAIEHLDIWLTYQRHWCEHKPSVTITVKEHEWMEVGAWVYEHFDECSGVSFLPYDGGTYKQAPYQECTKEEYEALLAKMPKEINWDRLQEFEKEDTTTGTQELSCVAGICEITDIGKK